MSDLVSKQLTMPTLPDSQISHLNSMNRADSIMPNILQGSNESFNSNPATQQLASSSMCLPMDYHPTFCSPMGREMLTNNVDIQQFAGPVRGLGQTPSTLLSSGQTKWSTVNKRKATTEPIDDNRGLQKMFAPNKAVAQMGSYAKAPSLSQISAPNKRSTQSTFKTNATGKKVVQIEPMKNGQPQVSPKIQTESFDSVRTKLRESLASALSLVSQEPESSLDGKIKKENEVSAQEGASEHNPQALESSTGAALVEPLQGEVSYASSIPSVACNDAKNISQGFDSNGLSGDGGISQTESFMGTDLQSITALPGEDTLFSSSFYFKDDFLHGNGLSWESDLTSHIPEVGEPEQIVKPELMHEDLTSDEDSKINQSPESLAFVIESELFKLYGGVNKKYKEKGRSLLFNLKDRNNPELRERVMSGDIPPDRLCSMTAEELASKELSQWRIAKAEELDHMKVLPNTDVNMRRLVKKTHKGEYQVDFDVDVGASEEIPIATSVPSGNPSKKKKYDKASPKVELSKPDQCEITIPNEGDDMQGLMVDDVKDLPPIISLDEFMESLNKEPPFENLPVVSATSAPVSDKENLDICSEAMSPVNTPEQSKSRSPVQPLKHYEFRSTVQPAKQSVQVVSPEKKELLMEDFKADGDVNAAGSQKGLEAKAAIQLRKSEFVWEGQLQLLNPSSMASFMAVHKSGEKASTKEWAGFFEIKGRVRLDAFDKFLQALPTSRSRAIMVCHFVLKESSADSERSSLVELVDSYISDERVGYAEPAPGVELYLCPPRTKTVDMIINHLPKNYTDKLYDIDDGLIGIVVWRKVQITSSAISPNSLSHQTHMTKKQSGGQYVENDMNRNAGKASRSAPHPPITPTPRPVVEDDDDDVPPGFGPPGSREDDDLPEFNFSGGSDTPVSSHLNPSHILGRGVGSQNHSRAPSQQVEQMRALIQKYGQNGNGGGGAIPIEPWNDDDDDIPEWQPQESHQAPPPTTSQPVHNLNMQSHMVNYPPHMANQQTFQRPLWPPAAQSVPPPFGVQQQGAWGPYGPNSVGGSPRGQFFGAPGPVPGRLGRDRRSNAFNNRNV